MCVDAVASSWTPCTANTHSLIAQRSSDNGMIAGTTIMPTLNMECPCLDGQELHWPSTTMLYRYISERRNGAGRSGVRSATRKTVRSGPHDELITDREGFNVGSGSVPKLRDSHNLVAAQYNMSR